MILLLVSLLSLLLLSPPCSVPAPGGRLGAGRGDCGIFQGRGGGGPSSLKAVREGTKELLEDLRRTIGL